jgi:uncharacterized membrane protein YcaP (DUF421 family)
MQDFIDTFFGHGKDLNALQMACRSAAIFFITLMLIRIAGLRTFGRHSAFDNVVIIMLGAILSRPVVGASAFLPSCIASLVFVLIHRLLAGISFYSDFVGRLIKGDAKVLYTNGAPHLQNMKTTHVSTKDLHEGLRLNAQTNDLQKIKEIIIERNGEISVIKEEEEPIPES